MPKFMSRSKALPRLRIVIIHHNTKIIIVNTLYHSRYLWVQESLDTLKTQRASQSEHIHRNPFSEAVNDLQLIS